MKLDRPLVVIVDDNTQRATALRVEIEELGFPVVVAATAAEAIHNLALRPHAIVVLDLLRPDAAAIAALQHVGDFSNTMVIIAFAVNESTDVRNRAMEMHLDFRLVTHGTNSLLDRLMLSENELLQRKGIFRAGNTLIESPQGILRTPDREIQIAPATAAILLSLMKDYPNSVTRIKLQVDVIHFAPDAHSRALDSRVYQARKALRAVNSDLAIQVARAGSLKLVVLTQRERERERAALEQPGDRQPNGWQPHVNVLCALFLLQ